MPRESTRKRKRKFRGNKHATGSHSIPKVKRISASAKKISANCHRNVSKNDDYNIIINLGKLKSILTNVLRCPNCERHGGINLSNDLAKRMGFCYHFVLTCRYCKYKHSDYSSDPISYRRKQKQKELLVPGPLPFKINIQTVLAFREIGKGYQAMRDFSSYMNFPPPLSKFCYNQTNSLLYDCYKEVAEASCKNAADEVRVANGNKEDVSNCQVSVDGTWQKRGHASINGVVTVISKTCFGCKMWEGKKYYSGYNDWLLNHVCSTNHEGSSGAMEAAGAKVIFHRSVKRNSLRYTEYLDGDTSSYLEVNLSKPYGHIDIRKLECVGHVQKRLGTRCRSLRDSLKKQKLSDGKSISGRGRLTEKAMNTLQNCFGMAIRQNTGNLYKMKKCVWAVLYHNTAISHDSERHKFCPREANS